MNWLAHLLLSKRNTEFQVGNFLADPLKARPWEGASQSLIDGMNMHKAIDAFTDSHDVISQSKARLGKKGYLKGVIIDLLFDHYLAKSWGTYAEQSLDDFINDFNARASVVAAAYPSKPKRIVMRLVEADKLREYVDFSGFVNAVTRLDTRLSERIKRKDSALRYVPLVESEYEALSSDFDAFFPDLSAFFQNHRLGSRQDTFLIS